MPSIASQRMKLDIIDSQPVSVVHKVTNGHTIQPTELQLPVSESPKALISPSCRPVTPDMTSTGNLHQRHPIDELNCEPEIIDRTAQLRTESTNSSSGSSDFGPFVSGFGDAELRPRSSSFNSSITREHRTSAPTMVRVDPLRRLSESQQTISKTSSAENVTAFHPPYAHVQLRHSHTVPEIPPMALSIDSGYHTPPQNRQPAPPAPNTSPPWPPNTHAPWQLHPLPAHDHPAMCGPSSLMPLTIDTAGGHYQPERSGPIHPPYMSMQPPPVYTAGYSQQRSHDGYGSLQQPGSHTPEEGVCAYQRERKLRLQNVLQEEEVQVNKLKGEEQQLLQQLAREQEENREIDNGAMEKEVEIMKRENQKLAAQIQQLLRSTPPVQNRHIDQPPVSSTVVHVGVPSAPPTPAPRVNSPSRHVIGQQSSPSYSEQAPPAIPLRPHPPTTVPPPPPVVGAEDSPQWACSQCTLLNHHLISICEVCETPRPRAGML